MGTDQRPSGFLWLPLVIVAVWAAATAPFSVTMTIWGLGILCAGAAVARWTLSRRSPFSIRRRSVDVSILAAFAVAFTFLGLTGHLG